MAWVTGDGLVRHVGERHRGREDRRPGAGSDLPPVLPARGRRAPAGVQLRALPGCRPSGARTGLGDRPLAPCRRGGHHDAPAPPGGIGPGRPTPGGSTPLPGRAPRSPDQRGCAGFGLDKHEVDRARIDVAFLSTGLPRTSPSGDRPTVIAGQARGVIALWLATRGMDPADATATATAFDPVGRDAFTRGLAWPEECTTPSWSGPRRTWPQHAR